MLIIQHNVSEVNKKMKDRYLLNRNIKRVLKEKGVMQKEFAVRLGISEQVAGKIVNSRRVIYADEIKPICNALGVSVSELYEER